MGNLIVLSLALEMIVIAEAEVVVTDCTNELDNNSIRPGRALFPSCHSIHDSTPGSAGVDSASKVCFAAQTHCTRRHSTVD